MSSMGLVNFTVPNNLKEKPFRFRVGDTEITLFRDSNGYNKIFILANKELPIERRKVCYEKVGDRKFVKEVSE